MLKNLKERVNEYLTENNPVQESSGLKDFDDSIILGEDNYPSGIDEAFVEMAGRIPGEIRVDVKGKKVLLVAVGANETRGVAHFHVFRNSIDLRNWKNGACLMFTENKYFDHTNNTETLDKDEIGSLVKKLKEVAPDMNGLTWWNFIVQLWNFNNENWSIPAKVKMPDYDYKTITRFKISKRKEN